MVRGSIDRRENKREENKVCYSHVLSSRGGDVTCLAHYPTNKLEDVYGEFQLFQI